MRVYYIILSNFVNVWKFDIMKILKHIEKFASIWINFFAFLHIIKSIIIKLGIT